MEPLRPSLVSLDRLGPPWITPLSEVLEHAERHGARVVDNGTCLWTLYPLQTYTQGAPSTETESPS